MARLFHLHLPSYSHGFESQTHQLHFSICIIEIVTRKGRKKQKEAEIGPFFNKRNQTVIVQNGSFFAV